MAQVLSPGSIPTLTDILDPSTLILPAEIMLVDALAQMTSAGKARQLLPENDGGKTLSSHGCVLVTRQDRLVGIFTERDLVKLAATQTALDQVTLAHVMKPPPISLQSDHYQNVTLPWMLFRDSHIRHLPVIDEQQRPMGVISLQSLIKALRPEHLLRCLRVQDLMSTRVISAPPTATLLQIAQQMVANQVSTVVITQTMNQSPPEGVTPVGIITERDIVQFQQMELDLAHLLAEPVMSAPLFLARPTDKLWDMHQKMLRHHIRRMVVASDSSQAPQLQGIITQTDFLRLLNPLELYDITQTLSQQVHSLQSAQEELPSIEQKGSEESTSKSIAILEEKLKFDRVIQAVITAMHQSLDLERILQTAVQGIQQTLKIDRVVIYQQDFNLNQCDVIVEATKTESLSLLKQSCKNGGLKSTLEAITDRENSEIPSNRRKILRALQIRSWCAAPIYNAGQLWGWIAAQNCYEQRLWTQSEQVLVAQLATQIAIAIHQAELSQRVNLETQERQIVETALAASQTFKRAMELAIPDLLIRMTGEGDYLEEKPGQGFPMLLPSSRDLSKVNVRDILPEAAAQQRLEMAQAALKTGQIQIYEFTLEINQCEHWQEARLVPTDENEVLVIIRDITARKLAEQENIRLLENLHHLNQSLEQQVSERTQALEASETQYRTLVETSQGLIWAMDQDFRFTFVNQAVRHLYGYEPEEMVGRPFTDFQTPDQAEKDRTVAEQVLQGQSQFDYETVHLTKTGKPIHLLFNAVVLRDAQGNIQGGSGTAIDITARKQAERSLRLSQTLLDKARDSILVMNESAEILQVNESACQRLGYSQAELLRMKFFSIFPDISLSAYTQRIETLGKQGMINFESICRTKQNSVFPVEVRSHLVSFDGELYKFAIIQDITERKQAEKQLIDQAWFLESIYEQSETLLFVTDVTENQEFKIFDWNPATEKRWQLPRHIFCGKALGEVFGPKNAATMEEKFRLCLKARSPIQYEECLTLQGKPAWFFTSITPLIDETGQIYRFIGSSIEITQNKQAEIALQKQAEREQLLRMITQRIHRSLDLQEIQKIVVTELSRIFEADRAIILQAVPEDGYIVVNEAINQFLPVPSILHWTQDTFSEDYHQFFLQSQPHIVPDPDLDINSTSMVDFITQAKIQSLVIAPIVQVIDGQAKLWGLISLHACLEHRIWQPVEADFLQQVANQVAISIKQAQLYQQSQQEITERKVVQNLLARQLEREKLLAQITQQIRGSLDSSTILKTTAQLLRDTFYVSRCHIFRIFELTPLQGELVASACTPDYPNRNQWKCLIEVLPDNILKVLHQDAPLSIENVYHEPDLSPIIKTIKVSSLKSVMAVRTSSSDSVNGCIVLDQCDYFRTWKPDEILLLESVAYQVGLAISQAQLLEQSQRQSHQLDSQNQQLNQKIKERKQAEQALENQLRREQLISHITQQIRESLEVETIVQTTVAQIGQALQVSRCVFWDYTVGSSPTLVVTAESLQTGIESMLGVMISIHPTDTPHCHQVLLQDQPVICHDIDQNPLIQPEVEFYKACQIQSMVVLRTSYRGIPNGVLGLHQCNSQRVWTQDEIHFLELVAAQVGIALAQAELLRTEQHQRWQLNAQNQLLQREIQDRQLAEYTLQKQLQREKILLQITRQIRQSLDTTQIFQTALRTLRHLLQTDRACIIEFDPQHNNGSGYCIAEDISSAYPSMLGSTIEDPCFTNLLTRDTTQKKVFGLTDINHVEDECYRQMLLSFHIRASLAIPIYKGEFFWGLFCLHQCTEPKDWQEGEIRFVQHITDHLGVALQQAQLLDGERQRRAELAQRSDELLHKNFELEKARRTADRANQAKSHFLANMSHELRTPLNVILGFTQLMQRDGQLQDHYKKHIHLINRSGEHLLALINNVLDMSKIEAQKLVFHPTNFETVAFLEAVYGMMRIRADAKQLQFKQYYGPNLPKYLHQDEGKLRQVLINLLDNAIKFTPQGTVSLRVETHTPTILRFIISDTGPGIAPEERAHLFKPFVQTQTGLQTSEGSGLGLAICQQFVELMEGQINVQSQLGQGTSFTVEIPLTTATVPPENPACALSVVGLAAGQPDYRLLVVDDHSDSLQLLQLTLETIGFQVQTAVDGEDAIAKAQQWRPHLIWMDIRMPNMDGNEAAKKIKQSVLPKPIIIALTAHTQENYRQSTLASGCDDYVNKPYSNSHIFEVMAHHLGVKYRYANPDIETPTPQISSNQTSPSPPTDLQATLNQSLQLLPNHWIKSLHEAASRLSNPMIHQIVQQLPMGHEVLSEQLLGLSLNFRYDTIVSILQPYLDNDA